MIAGRDAAVPGEAKNSWLTGTAAWNWLCATQYLLGIRPGYDSLLIDPCLPASFGAFEVTRRWRDAVYAIKVLPRPADGIARICLDGVPVDGNAVPYSPGFHTVTAEVL